MMGGMDDMGGGGGGFSTQYPGQSYMSGMATNYSFLSIFVKYH